MQLFWYGRNMFCQRKTAFIQKEETWGLQRPLYAAVSPWTHTRPRERSLPPRVNSSSRAPLYWQSLGILPYLPRHWHTCQQYWTLLKTVLTERIKRENLQTISTRFMNKLCIIFQFEAYIFIVRQPPMRSQCPGTLTWHSRSINGEKRFFGYDVYVRWRNSSTVICNVHPLGIRVQLPGKRKHVYRCIIYRVIQTTHTYITIQTNTQEGFAMNCLQICLMILICIA